MLKRLFSLAILSILGLSLTATAQRTPHVVFMIGEDEYHTLETQGYRITIVQQDAQDKNNFPGLVDALRSADLLFVSVRRRTPPVDQMKAIRTYLEAGKPLVGIRTACHAFA